MLTNNPFAALTEFLPPTFMQWYVALMILAVILGTLFDVVHKGSARYFFDNWRKSRSRKGSNPVGGGELVAIALKTGFIDVMTSAEFCTVRRRLAHLLGMYGFVLYVIATVALVFGASAGAIWAQLWWLGALMVCVGGYWFWFFIRVDVLAEGHSPLRVVRADLFILSLLASCTLALAWGWAQAAGSPGARVLFWLYLLATTVLFGGVPWSKFAHMFFKPAAAFEKRVSNANGTRSNLPAPADKPEQLGGAREIPRHY